MAYETVTCVECGSEYRVQMYGSHKSRDYKVANWSDTCDECKSKAAECSDLVGSDKQVAWAISIRDHVRPAMLEAIEDINSKMDKLSNDTHKQIAIQVVAKYAKMANETNASWWIDNRSAAEKSDWTKKMIADMQADADPK